MAKLSLIADSLSDNICSQINIVKELKLDYIELRTVNGKNIVDNTYKEIKVISEKLINSKLKVYSICTSIGKPNINEPFSLQISKLHKSLRIAKTLKAENIRIFSNILCHNLEIIKLMSKLSNTYKVKICIENEKNTSFAKINNIINFFQYDYNKKIGLTLDIANFVELKESPINAINLLKDQVTYFHIRDLDINNKEIQMFNGMCEIKRILSFVKNKNMFITYEPKIHHISSNKKYDFVANNVNKLINFMYEENQNVLL